MASEVSPGGEDAEISTVASATKLKDKLRTFAYTMSSNGAQQSPKRYVQTRLDHFAPNARAASLRTRAMRKREVDEDLAEVVATSPATKKKRTTTKERSASDPYQVKNKLVDSLRPDLTLVFIGLNPGLTTAATGHAYSHASNLFWKLLHWSGVTPIRHPPSDTHNLMDLYSIGNTNICARPTRSGDGLSKQELEDGALILEEKMAHYQPEAVCIVGKGIWDVIYKVKTGKVLKKGEFSYGWQKEELWLGRIVDNDGTILSKGSRTFVSTTTSGLAAGMSLQEKKDVWAPLGTWLQQQRGNLAVADSLPNYTGHNDSPDIKVEADGSALVKQEREDE